MFINNLHKVLPDLEIKENWPLNNLCTLRVGGNAEFFVSPNSIEDIRILYNLALNENFNIYILGGGSNVIFPDGLIKGIVISTLKLNSFSWRTELTADIDAGFKLPLIMKELREKSLGGMEFAAGIPGTLGGAIMGNAGAGGHGVCELLEEVVTIESNGGIKTWPVNEINYSYRKCSLSDKNEKRIILSAKMTFRKSNPKDKDVLESFMLRRGSQPHAFGNAGCTFKNPEGYAAGKLLDECGCKNLCVGDAVVSDKHANFILNRGHATSSDVIKLIKICAEKVFDNTGIRLEPEIKILGE